jgi:hypothetical protein
MDSSQWNFQKNETTFLDTASIRFGRWPCFFIMMITFASFSEVMVFIAFMMTFSSSLQQGFGLHFPSKKIRPIHNGE